MELESVLGQGILDVSERIIGEEFLPCDRSDSNRMVKVGQCVKEFFIFLPGWFGREVQATMIIKIL